MDQLTLKDHLQVSREQFATTYSLDLYPEEYRDEIWEFIDAKIKQAWTVGKIESRLTEEEQKDYLLGVVDLEEVIDTTKGRQQALVGEFVEKFSDITNKI